MANEARHVAVTPKRASNGIVQWVPARIAVPADAPLTWLFGPRPSITVRADTRAESFAIAAASQDLVVDTARADPAASGSVIAW